MTPIFEKRYCKSWNAKKLVHGLCFRNSMCIAAEQLLMLSLYIRRHIATKSKVQLTASNGL